MAYTSIMTDEIWKDVPNFDGIYQVSNKGRVRSFLKKSGFVGYEKCEMPRMMSIIPKDNGYMYVTLMKNGKRHNKYIHRLVAEAFIHKIPKGWVINHLDYDRSNNAVENLEITTQGGNIQHSIEHMKKPRKRTGNYYITDRGDRYEVYVKLKYIGSYKTIEEARSARDEYISSINYY